MSNRLPQTFETPAIAYYETFGPHKAYTTPLHLVTQLCTRQSIKKQKTRKTSRSSNENCINAAIQTSNFYSPSPERALRSLMVSDDTVIADSTTVITPESLPIEVKPLIRLAKTLSGLTQTQVLKRLVGLTQGIRIPDQARVDTVVEETMSSYMQQRIMRWSKSRTIKVFPTFGSNVALTQLFDALVANNVVPRGSKVAILTPSCPSFMELPLNPAYDFVQVFVDSRGSFEEVADTRVRALLITNPNFCTGNEMNDRVISRIKKAAVKNPNLIIVVDNSLAPFSKLASDAPSLEDQLWKNVISIFSMSEYLGLPGFQLSLIAMASSHVANKLMDRKMSRRYRSLCPDPEKLAFIDCIALESQKIGTIEMSGIQQVTMCLAALGELTDKKDQYGTQARKRLKERREVLRAACRYAPSPSPDYATDFYMVLNIPEIALRVSDDPSLSQYIQSTSPIEFVMSLAEIYNIAIMPCMALAGDPWDIRVTVANISHEDAGKIGESVLDLIAVYDKKRKKDREKLLLK